MLNPNRRLKRDNLAKTLFPKNIKRREKIGKIERKREEEERSTA